MRGRGQESGAALNHNGWWSALDEGRGERGGGGVRGAGGGRSVAEGRRIKLPHWATLFFFVMGAPAQAWSRIRLCLVVQGERQGGEGEPGGEPGRSGDTGCSARGGRREAAAIVYAGVAAACLAALAGVDFDAFIKRLAVGDWCSTLPDQPSVFVRAQLVSLVMVATRGRDYDATGPRTRLQAGPAGVARRLVPPVANPQRMRRTRRMSTHPDPDHYASEGVNVIPESDTSGPVEGDGHTGPGAASGSWAAPVDAACATPASSTVLAGHSQPVRRRPRKNPHPKYIPPGSREAGPSGSGAAHQPATDDVSGEAACGPWGNSPSTTESASCGTSDGTSSMTGDLVAAAASPAACQARCALEEGHDGRMSLKRGFDAQHGSAGPAGPPPAPSPPVVPAPEFPEGIFGDAKPLPVLHAAGVSTTVIPSNEVLVKREKFWAVAAAAAASGPDPQARPTTDKGAQASTGGVRPRFSASQRPLLAMARDQSLPGAASGDAIPGAAGDTRVQVDGAPRHGAGAADVVGSTVDTGGGVGMEDSADGDAHVRGGQRSRHGDGDGRRGGDTAHGPSRREKSSRTRQL